MVRFWMCFAGGAKAVLSQTGVECDRKRGAGDASEDLGPSNQKDGLLFTAMGTAVPSLPPPPPTSTSRPGAGGGGSSCLPAHSRERERNGLGAGGLPAWNATGQPLRRVCSFPSRPGWEGETQTDSQASQRWDLPPSGLGGLGTVYGPSSDLTNPFTIHHLQRLVWLRSINSLSDRRCLCRFSNKPPGHDPSLSSINTAACVPSHGRAPPGHSSLRKVDGTWSGSALLALGKGPAAFCVNPGSPSPCCLFHCHGNPAPPPDTQLLARSEKGDGCRALASSWLCHLAGRWVMSFWSLVSPCDTGLASPAGWDWTRRRHFQSPPMPGLDTRVATSGLTFTAWGGWVGGCFGGLVGC